MGSSASKASRAAGSAARQYPTRAPPTRSPPSASVPPPPPPPPPQPTTANARRARAPPPPGPTVKPAPSASTSRDQSINLNASDPDFAQSLRSIGPVQPNPTLSSTSTFNPSHGATRQGPDPGQNPAVLVLDARSKLQAQAEAEFMEAGRRRHEGRQFLDVYTIRQVLTLRDGHRQSSSEIERKLGLKKGVVDRLGTPGVVGLTTETGRAEQEIRMV